MSDARPLSREDQDGLMHMLSCSNGGLPVEGIHELCKQWEATVRAVEVERDAERARAERLRAGASQAIEALSDYLAGYGDPANREALIDEAGRALHAALADDEADLRTRVKRAPE